MKSKLYGRFIIVFGIVLFISFAFSRPFAFTTRSQELNSIDFNFFSRDIQKNYISQGYGATLFGAFNYLGRRHNGIDIVARKGAPIYSATKGTVLTIGNQDDFCYRKGFGKFIVIENSDDDFITFYAHLNSILVEPDEEIARGEKIATVGETGFATGAHLHFSVFEKEKFTMKNKNGCGPTPEGKDVNPFKYLETI